jgi:hypothetical protein
VHAAPEHPLDDPVDADAARDDELLGCSPGGEAGIGDDLLKPDSVGLCSGG